MYQVNQYLTSWWDHRSTYSSMGIFLLAICTIDANDSFISCAVVFALEILIRMANLPFHTVPPHQQVPACCSS